MHIKRYTPKYKKLVKLRRILWLEKRRKLRLFHRCKWDALRKLYAPQKLRRLRKYDQDLAACKQGNDYETRLKKVYGFLLRDKQSFQLYYGSERLRFYQLKTIALGARELGLRRDLSSARVFYHLMESRLDVLLYRLSFVTSLMQSRKLLASNCIEVSGSKKNLGFYLTYASLIRVEGMMLMILISSYLKSTALFFYYGKLLSRRFYMVRRLIMMTQSFFQLHRRAALFFSSTLLLRNERWFSFYLNDYTKKKSFIYTKDYFESFSGYYHLINTPYNATFFPENLKLYFYGFSKLMYKIRLSKFFSYISWFFQFNGFFVSFLEDKKKAKLQVIKSSLGQNNYFCKFSPSGSPDLSYGLKYTQDLSDGFCGYEYFYADINDSARKSLIRDFKKGKLLSKFLFFRFSPYLSEFRKEDSLSSSYFFKKRKRLSFIFRYYPRINLRLRYTLKKRRLKLKKLLWKKRKKKKWRQKRWGLLGKILHFRSRNKYSRSGLLYFPRNVEINLKTFSFFYLGYTDIESANTRIYFWMNLRKLLTFLLK